MPVQPAQLRGGATARALLAYHVDRIVAFFTGSDVGEPTPIVVAPAPINPSPARTERGHGGTARRGNGTVGAMGRRDGSATASLGERRDGKRMVMPAGAPTCKSRGETRHAASRRAPSGGSKGDGRPRKEHRHAGFARRWRKQTKSVSLVSSRKRDVDRRRDGRASDYARRYRPSPSIAAAGRWLLLDSIPETPSTEGQEDRGRRRRRRRGRGGRDQSGGDVAASGNGNALAAEELNVTDVASDEPDFSETEPVTSALINEPLIAAPRSRVSLSRYTKPS